MNRTQIKSKKLKKNLSDISLGFLKRTVKIIFVFAMFGQKVEGSP